MNLPQNSIIASGPVIIENGKVLLNRQQKTGYVSDWMFPGGEVEDFDASLEDACHREVGEEMGIHVNIIKPLRPILLHQNDRVILLIHYLAKRIGDVLPGKEIVEWDWHDTDNLPKNCAQNVFEIIEDIKKDV